MRRAAPLLCLPLLAAAAAYADPDDEARPAAPQNNSGVFELSVSQQQAVGIHVDHPTQMSGPQQVEAYGLVLDPVALISDAGRVDSTAAAAAAAAADAARVDSLYRNNADASLKALQSARAQEAEAGAQAQTAAATFRLQWGPIAAMNPAARKQLIEQLADGRHLLVRADVPGHSVLGTLALQALVVVDQISLAARVLGPLPRTDLQSQSSGWLLEIERRPEGLGPGARTRVQLQARPESGVLVPAAALLYSDQGAYVFRQSSGQGGKAQYSAVPVKLLLRVGEGWLVAGLGDDDSIVVQGAGVLWSLQGISTFSAAEEEHD